MQIRVHHALLAAAFVGVAASSEAQQPRIPVTKDRAPADTRASRDTVYLRDTVTVYRRDTVTVTREVQAPVAAIETPLVDLPRAFYVQLGGGATFPQSRLDDFFDTGFNVTGSLGFQPANSALGLRFDVAYDRLMGEEQSAALGRSDDASVWSGLANATLNLPIGDRMSGSGVYLIGGGGVHHFTDFADLNSTGFNSGSGETSSTDFGLNAGGGVRFGWGRAALFAESRYFHVFTENERSQFVPLVLGLTFR